MTMSCQVQIVLLFVVLFHSCNFFIFGDIINENHLSNNYKFFQRNSSYDFNETKPSSYDLDDWSMENFEGKILKYLISV